MKKFVALFLALLMAASLMTVGASATDAGNVLLISPGPAAAAAKFTDEASFTYPDAVNKIAELGIVGGYGDGSFGAKGTLSRGAAAKIITGMMLSADEIAALPKGADPYPDVKADSTFGPYISYLKEKGVIGGYADGTFKPSNDLSAIAFLKMLMGALGYSAEAEGFYGDGSSNKVLVKAMALNLSAGRSGFLTVESGCTREDACLYAYNALECTMVEYKDGAAVSTGKTYLETKFPEQAAAKPDTRVSPDHLYGAKLTMLNVNGNKNALKFYFMVPESKDAGIEWSFGIKVTNDADGSVVFDSLEKPGTGTAKLTEGQLKDIGLWEHKAPQLNIAEASDLVGQTLSAQLVITINGHTYSDILNGYTVIQE